MSYLNEITLYIYYTKKKYEFEYGEVFPIGSNIFAYTDDKKCMKLFESQRNMKLFKKEEKIFSREEYNEFRKFMNNSIDSDRYLYIDTYKIYSDDNIPHSIDIAVTITEGKRIEGRKMMLELDLTKYCWTPPYVFNDEVFKALKVLKYVDVSSYIGNYSYSIINNENPDVDMSDLIKINDFELVSTVIGRTLKV